jgi:hypothetical protein
MIYDVYLYWWYALHLLVHFSLMWSVLYHNLKSFLHLSFLITISFDWRADTLLWTKWIGQD